MCACDWLYMQATHGTQVTSRETDGFDKEAKTIAI